MLNATEGGISSENDFYAPKASRPVIGPLAHLPVPEPKAVLCCKRHEEMENVTVAVTEKDFEGRAAVEAVRVELDVGAPGCAAVGEVDSDALPATQRTKSEGRMRVRGGLVRQCAGGRWEGGGERAGGRLTLYRGCGDRGRRAALWPPQSRRSRPRNTEAAAPSDARCDSIEEPLPLTAGSCSTTVWALESPIHSKYRNASNETALRHHRQTRKAKTAAGKTA